ncbi:hypothetical protein GCM10010191_15950 [Actinomadura vinacea]|uniref:DUF4352 domain-containing protein n=1 Tax=Actinomadura vinacea TaxID=115336 RepID=A0ABN3ILU9_9ACTN
MRPAIARLRAGCAAAALAAAALPACSASEPDPAPVYAVPPERVRDGEQAIRGRTGRSADLEFTVLGYRDGIREILGTHADRRSKGRYVRVRLLAVNRGRDIQVFDTWKQVLLTTDGRAHVPDMSATMIKRQPERLSVGAAMRAEFDLWYDVPGNTPVKGVRLFGSPPVGAVSDPPGAEIELP